MKLTFYIVFTVTTILFTSCLRPTEECEYALNRPECENCCIQNSMEYYDWEHLDQECYCK